MIDREACAVVMRLLDPTAPPFAIDAAVEAAAAALGKRVTTGDKIAPPAAAPTPPAPAAGQVVIEVVEASQRTWPDSGEVLSLVLRRVDDPAADEIRTRFTADRAVPRRIAMEALGHADGEPVESLVGKRATVVLGSYTGRDGVERQGVNRWVAPKKPAKPAAASGLAMPVRKPDLSGVAEDESPF